MYVYIYVREMNDSERYDKSKFLIEKEELFGCMPIDH